MEYINYIRAKTHIGTATKSEKPVLSEEDEQFLAKITSQHHPPPLPVAEHGGDAQIALMNGAQDVALPPETPSELSEEPDMTEELVPEESTRTKKKTWNWLRRDSRDARQESRDSTAEGLHSLAETLKAKAAEETPEEAQAKQEEQDMTIMLEQLNLAAVNNRVFSISDDTQVLLQKFNQVLKDLMNGVPTAYHDLESLLANGDRQLQKTYEGLPSFLQKLIEKLPQAMTKGIAPEMMAAAASRASAFGINLEKSGKAAGSAAKLLKTPSLKDLATKPGAVSGMLKTIMQFLKTRFPAFAGVNVLWSLALFLLLIVFWYCYKRGKEVRLDKERELTEKEVQELEEEWKESRPTDGSTAEPQEPPRTTMAPPGASMEHVKAGIIEADVEKIAAASQAREPTAESAVP